MSTLNGITKNSTRTIRKVEAPRPLKKSLSETKNISVVSPLALSVYNIESVDKLLILMDMVIESILQNEESPSVSADTSSLLTKNIEHLCKHLKIFGPQLENTIYQSQLDRVCLVFREAMVRGFLEHQAKVYILEILELRVRSWKVSSGKNVFGSSNTETDASVDLSDLKNYVKNYSLSTNSTNDVGIMGPDEVLKRSNRRDKVSKSSSKNYFKDEIVIRNSDSGKVVPTAKERLVQITGANEESVLYATRLIGDTIRNNSSPVRGPLSLTDTSSSSEESVPGRLVYEELGFCENETKNCLKAKTKSNSVGTSEPFLYKHKVVLSNCNLTIIGDDYTYVTVAKAVLDTYFSKLRQSAEAASEDLNCEDVFFENMLGCHQSAKKPSLNSPLETEPISLPTTASTTLETSDSSSSPSLPESRVSQSDFELCNAITSSPCPTENRLLLNPLPKVTNADDTIDSAKTLINDKIFDEIEKPTATNDIPPANIDELTKTYTKEFILECRTTELSQQKPQDWDYISSKFPNLVKISEEPIDVLSFDKSEE